MVKERAEKFPGEIILEYSPESFTGTEPEFALEICTAVQEAWGGDSGKTYHYQPSLYGGNDYTECVC